MSYSIGEVLNQLTSEFEDVTISKIRFLEAEGLIRPDRTESGYRQFFDADVDRLRYILRAQRDRYLPLKVIKTELDRIDAGLPVTNDDSEPDRDAVADLRSAGDGETRSSEPQLPIGATDVSPPLGTETITDVQLTLSELAEACGLEQGDLRALGDHGLLRDSDRFDGTDLIVARAASALLGAGLEPRHLRMYRQFSDRELALLEQLIKPLLRQRNPDSRRAAAELAEQISGEGARIHRALLAREVRALLRS